MMGRLIVTASIAAAVLIPIAVSVSQAWLQGDDDVFASAHDEKRSTTSYRLNYWIADPTPRSDETRVDLVVVAGAWRRPNGTLSAAFERRIEHGLRTAMILGARHVLFTGGLNDSTEALSYANDMSDASARLFPLSFVDALPNDHHRNDWQRAAREVHAALQRCPGKRLQEVLRWLNVHAGPSSFHWPQFHTENVSLTTFENAVQTRKWIDEHDALFDAEDSGCPRSSPLHVVVVTSPFHTRRCKILFAKALESSGGAGVHDGTPMHTHVAEVPDGAEPSACRPSEMRRDVRVHVSGARGDMFEWLMPDELISWVDVVPPTLEKVPLMPRWLKVWGHSVYCTYRNWRAHVRMTLLSVEGYSMMREMGAFVKGIVLGQLSCLDLLRAWLTY